jgi:hypothetical protein
LRLRDYVVFSGKTCPMMSGGMTPNSLQTSVKCSKDAGAILETENNGRCLQNGRKRQKKRL